MAWFLPLISALADDLLGAAEDHVVNILLHEVIKHCCSHAPFFHLLQFAVYALEKQISIGRIHDFVQIVNTFFMQDDRKPLAISAVALYNKIEIIF